MLVDVIKNAKDASKRLAILQIKHSRWGSFRINGYFSSDVPAPEEGERDVMISGVLLTRYTDGEDAGKPIPNTPPIALFLREITPDVRKVEYEGFRFLGPRGQKTTTSNARDPETGERFLITPGRLLKHVYRARLSTKNGLDSEKLVGGIGYVSLDEESSYYRLEGVGSPEQLEIFDPTLPDF